jgi:hypothetical protein
MNSEENKSNLGQEFNELRLEIEKKFSELSKNHRPSLISSTIIVAIVGFVGTFTATYVAGLQNQKLEKIKLESNLLLKAVETGDINKNKINIKFLLDAGFISDEQGKLRKLLTDSTANLELPSPSGNRAYAVYPKFSEIVSDPKYFCYGTSCSEPITHTCKYCGEKYISQKFYSANNNHPFRSTLCDNTECKKSTTGFHDDMMMVSPQISPKIEPK